MIMSEDERVEEEGPIVLLELEQIKKELEGLSKEQLIDELAMYRLVIPKLGPYVKWVIENYFKPVYVRFRMGRETVGYLVGAVLVPETLQLLAQEEVKKYASNKTYVKHDIRIVNCPIKELSFYDVILEEGDWEEQEGFTY